MIRFDATAWAAMALLLGIACAVGAETTIDVDGRQPGRPVSRYLAGACIEDVNHEIYGGIYSQMLFGESFQEPPAPQPIKGFNPIDGQWEVQDGQLIGPAGPGPKLISTLPAFSEGQAGVEINLPGKHAGNAGLIVDVSKARPGADAFNGYEVSLDSDLRRLRLGRHEGNFALLADVPCDVSPDRWIKLAVRLSAGQIEIEIDGKTVLRHHDDHPLPPGTIGLRQWQRPARYRNPWVTTAGQTTPITFESSPRDTARISRMWAPLLRGEAHLQAQIETAEAFTGVQSQRLTFSGGSGEAGIENRGLNRQGLAYAKGSPYEGYLWLRAPRPIDVYVSLESNDDSRVDAQTRIHASGDSWRRYDFTLTPQHESSAGQFAIMLRSPGSVVVGHAFLQPGQWGRFKGLPLRRDVVEALIDQGITVLRYGGSMVNAPEYRWKKMIGPRDRRPPYRGTWYPYSSDGWGIIDFLDLCESAGFLPVPDFNIDESAADMRDFIEYANGPASSPWGQKRAADGHPKPYNLRHIELGNEERIDQRYFEKFAAIAKAVWDADPEVVLVAGDFAYEQPIQDATHLTGAASGISSLEFQRKILELARQRGREVWFDVHIGTEGPQPSGSARALPAYIDAIDKLASGAKHKVVVFELNAGNHAMRRALANAQSIGGAMRDGRLPIVTSANCLQVDGQNDNGWDQGLLFLNPSRVWLQPPGYVTRMISRNYQPLVLSARVENGPLLDVTATRSADGKTLVLAVVNLDRQPRPARISLQGFTPASPLAEVQELAGPMAATNTALSPVQIQPALRQWLHGMNGHAEAEYTFHAGSFTVLRFE